MDRRTHRGVGDGGLKYAKVILILIPLCLGVGWTQDEST
jgi:hypothetical protein